jgi:hypothetical protein
MGASRVMNNRTMLAGILLLGAAAARGIETNNTTVSVLFTGYRHADGGYEAALLSHASGNLDARYSG